MLTRHHILVSLAMSWAWGISLVPVLWDTSPRAVQHPGLSIYLMVPLP